VIVIEFPKVGSRIRLESPRWITTAAGKVELDFGLPRQAVSLVELSW
jgi:hypothetical protein